MMMFSVNLFDFLSSNDALGGNIKSSDYISETEHPVDDFRLNRFRIKLRERRWRYKGDY